MLDFILSRLVLLAFLLLILGLLLSYQNMLGAFFLSNSAKLVAQEVGEKIRGIALNTALASEEKKIRLYPYLQAGPLRSSYTLKIGCVKEGRKVYLGLGIRDRQGHYLYIYKVELFLPGRNIELRYFKGEMEAGSVIRVRKYLDPDTLTLYIEYCGKDDRCTAPKGGEPC